MNKNTTVSAKWDRQLSLYACNDLGIYSHDGDTWRNDSNDNEADSEEFNAATIVLMGGPRNGEKVF